MSAAEPKPGSLAEHLRDHHNLPLGCLPRSPHDLAKLHTLLRKNNPGHCNRTF